MLNKSITATAQTFENITQIVEGEREWRIRSNRRCNLLFPWQLQNLICLPAIATVLEMMRRMLTWRMEGRERQHSEGRWGHASPHAGCQSEHCHVPVALRYKDRQPACERWRRMQLFGCLFLTEISMASVAWRAWGWSFVSWLVL